MNDRAVELLEQYEIEVLRTRKGRGAIICDTNQGCLILKEYTGTGERIELQNRLLREIATGGLLRAEQIIPSREGALTVKDNDGISYVLKTWLDGREFNLYDKSECLEAVRLLAKLHGCMKLPSDTPGIPAPFSPRKEYEKHNRELKRVRRYLQQRGQKTWFEISLLNTFDYFLEQAIDISGEWAEYCDSRGYWQQESDLRETISFCHGDYQYHNIIRGSDGWFLINFEKCLPDNPIRDLYLLLRKLLEKSNWSVALGNSLMEAYETVRPIDAMSRIDLYYRLAYPEKFWKIANFYYNSGKAWIPGKNQEKLEKLISQEKEKQHFLDEMFRDVAHLRK